MKVVRTHAGAARKVAGVVVGATALAIAFGVDQHFTTAVPGYTSALQKRIEQSSAARSQLDKLSGRKAAAAAGQSATGQPRAPDFVGIDEWLNTPNGRALSLAKLRGRVVLIDFWTYSCINCLRTLPHLEAWDRAYRKTGLTIVGVHSPEFAFEHVAGNVRSAVSRLGVRYPVALDNSFATWRAYSNDYWPSEYLIDRAGHIRHEHYGEGSYAETERLIRGLLGEKVRAVRTTVADTTPQELTTPESYLGYARLDRFASGAPIIDAAARYRFPGRLAHDELAYDGTWTVQPSRIVAGADAKVRLRFQAKRVFLVLGGTGPVQVLVDGKRLRTVAVSGTPRLYTLARFPELRRGLLELRVSPGVEGYAFTFG
jgi:thiol-disulfide isomerase/thioredoxin